MQTILQLVKIGNSRGLRLPAALIKRHCLSDKIRLVETSNGLLLQPEKSDKLSLEESFDAMARDSKALSEASQWAEMGLTDGLEEEEFSGWPR